MKIEYTDWITRTEMRSRPDVGFLFGDNLAKKGYGGQALEARGEPNAIGIPTKKDQYTNESSYFTDDEYDANCLAIESAFRRIHDYHTIVIPTAGLGTGRAQLKSRAPRTYAYLIHLLNNITAL